MHRCGASVRTLDAAGQSVTTCGRSSVGVPVLNPPQDSVRDLDVYQVSDHARSPFKSWRLKPPQSVVDFDVAGVACGRGPCQTSRRSAADLEQVSQRILRRGRSLPQDSAVRSVVTCGRSSAGAFSGGETDIRATPVAPDSRPGTRSAVVPAASVARVEVLRRYSISRTRSP